MICNIWKIKIWKKKRNIRHKDSVLIRYLSQGTELISVVTADVCDIFIYLKKKPHTYCDRGLRDMTIHRSQDDRKMSTHIFNIIYIANA